MPSIVVAGSNHRSAPPDVLERLSVSIEQRGPLYDALRAWTRESLVISTCNRTELYAVVAHATTAEDALPRVLSERLGVTAAEWVGHGYVYSGMAAVTHAIRVVAGLDSLVLGEDQILAQWKRALDGARHAGAMGPVLERLGNSALACGKRARTFTGIGRHSVSIESLAVQKAAERLTGWGDREVLVIGAGESAALVIRHLINGGAAPERISVHARGMERVARLVDAHGVAATDATELSARLAAVDAIFCCAASPEPVLTAANFARHTAPVICVDLGAPRNLDSDARNAPGVQYIDLEALTALANAHRAARLEHLPAAERLVEDAALRFMAWKAARGAAGSIARLQRHGERIADEETNRALARLPHGTERERRIIATLARRIVKRLMHAPTVRLKNHREADNLALALEAAFGLGRAEEELRRQLPGAHGGDGELSAPISEEIA